MRHVISELLARGEVEDEALSGRIISVSEVRVTPDLRQAIAFVQAVGADAEAQQQVCEALNRHRRMFKARLARRINTKYAAELEFRTDDSFVESARIDALLRNPQVAQDLEDDVDLTDRDDPDSE